MSDPIVIGIDPSLTATGVAVISDHIEVTTVPSTGHKGDTLDDRYRRLQDIIDEIMRPLEQLAVEPTFVVIEAPAMSRTTGSHHDRSGLWWLLVTRIRIALWTRPLEVSPTAVKKAMTGNGRASKDEMVAAVVREWPNSGASDNNACDALAMAAIGRHLVGDPIWTRPLTKPRRESLDRIATNLS